MVLQYQQEPKNLRTRDFFDRGEKLIFDDTIANKRELLSFRVDTSTESIEEMEVAHEAPIALFTADDAANTNRTIICDAGVLLTSGFTGVDNDDFIDWNSFDCIETGGDAIGLHIINLWSDFEDEWNLARAEGLTRLRVKGSITVDLNLNHLILPKDEQSFDREWLIPTQHDQSFRKLAQNHIGIPKVIVFHVTINHNEERFIPSNSAAEVSAKIFGNNSFETSMAQQFSACSFNNLNFTAATSSDNENITGGVYDIEVTTTGSHDDISVKSFSDFIFGLVLEQSGVTNNDYDHIMFHLPPGIYSPLNETHFTKKWIAFARVVSDCTNNYSLHIFDHCLYLPVCFRRIL